MKRRLRDFAPLRSVIPAIAVTLLTLSGGAAWSQATRTIRIVVPYAPGGVTDVLARLLAEHIGRAQGPTMLIENRPGASGAIGTEAVSRAAPDGNTLLINTSDMLVIPHLRKLNYDPLKSFEPICYLASVPDVIVVNSASPYRSLADLFDAARAKPGALTLASVGPASVFDISAEMLKRAAHVNMTYVPYPGGAPVLNALLGEHVTSALATYSTSAEQLKAGRLRALAAATRIRIEPLPDVPTVAESGYKDYEVDFWLGLFAPAGTPKAVVSQLAGWFAGALQAPEVKARLVVQGLYPVGTCGVDFAALLRKQYDEYGRIIREGGLRKISP
jgi:tripartite-type tricarboxylate transporter receptor subunit TctC